MNILCKSRHHCLQIRRSALSGVHIIAATLAFFILIPTNVVSAQTVPASLTNAERSKIEALLTDELQRIINTQKRIDGQGKYISVRTKIDIVNEIVIIDLSSSFVPRFCCAEMEDLQHELATAASELLRDIVRIRGVEFLYGSRDMYHYFPDEWRPTPFIDKGGSLNIIVASAMHGKYIERKKNQWEWQRLVYNGIREDLITPAYADELETWFYSRGENIDLVAFPRSRSLETHVPREHLNKSPVIVDNMTS